MRRIYFLCSIIIVLATIGCKNRADTNNVNTQSLQRTTPESAGISSEDILFFLDKVDEAYDEGIEMHSIMIVRNGKVITEGWWSPYHSDLRHTMYSLSKSFTSTAIGIAADEGMLKLTDKVMSFFPESLPDTISPYLAQLNIDNLLTMSVGQSEEPTAIRLADDWVSVFLSAPIDNEPGTVFHYNSASTFMLSAILQKVTGENLIDFLTPRLFNPLGIEDADWEENPQGISVGGWGLRIKTEDIAKLGLLYLQKGKWGDRQLLSEDWVNSATSKQIVTKVEDINPKSDWEQGYGFQFWQTTHNSFRGDGAFGQFMIVIPEKDVVIAITANVSDMQKEINLIWDYLYPAFQDNPLKENNAAYQKLKNRLSALSLPYNQEETSSPLEEDSFEKTYHYNENTIGIESVSVNFDNDICRMNLTQNGETYELKFANTYWLEGKTIRKGPSLTSAFKTKIPGGDSLKIAGNYTWIDNNRLKLVLRYIESPNDEQFLISFDESNPVIELSSNRNQYQNKTTIKGKYVTTPLLLVE